jgi:hypothetical protein
MVFWEIADEMPLGMGDVELEWARAWRDAEKVVYSATRSRRRGARKRSIIFGSSWSSWPRLFRSRCFARPSSQ